MGSYLEHENLVANICLEVSCTQLARVWPNPTGVAWREGVPVKYGLVGSSDIMGLLKNGRMLCIEVKSGKARLSDKQKNFRKMIESWGGVYLVCRSVDCAVEGVKRALAGG